MTKEGVRRCFQTTETDQYNISSIHRRQSFVSWLSAAVATKNESFHRITAESKD